MSEEATPAITDEQFEAIRLKVESKKAAEKKQRVMDAAKSIAEYANSLGMAIVGTAQLAEMQPGVMAIVTGWAVTENPNAQNQTVVEQPFCGDLCRRG